MMKNINNIKHCITFVILFFFNNAFSQNVIYVPNKSLEDTNRVTLQTDNAPLLWSKCQQSPQIYVSGEPYIPNATNGFNYILLEGSIWAEMYEQIGIKLNGTIKLNKAYFMYLDLSDLLGQYHQQAVAEIYGGTYLCDVTYKLWTSPGLDSSQWTRYKATFTAPADLDYIVLSGRNKDSADFQGAALIDNLSDIYDSAFYVGMDEVQIKASVAAQQEQLQISPNPTTNLLIIQSANMLIETVEVYDIMGRKQIQQLNNSTNQQLELDVSSLASGIYFVKVMDKQGRIKTGKFVKE